jgi:hypothetical protein
MNNTAILKSCCSLTQSLLSWIHTLNENNGHCFSSPHSPFNGFSLNLRQCSKLQSCPHDFQLHASMDICAALLGIVLNIGKKNYNSFSKGNHFFLPFPCDTAMLSC